MILRRLAAFAALPALALSLASAPAMAADNPTPQPAPDHYAYVCLDTPSDVVAGIGLGGLLGLGIDLDLFPGHYCGWVPVVS